MRYVIAFLACLTGVEAQAQYISDGEKIVLEGEVIASKWLDGSNGQNWQLLVRYDGRVWKCEERIGYMQCDKISN